MTTRVVESIGGPLDAVVRLPGSKSLTNRALVSAALAEGRSVLEGALFADDTDAMVDGLRRLGIDVEDDRTVERVTVDGCGGVLPDAAAGAELDARSSGTTARFLLPVLALGPGPTRLDGTPQLRVRPMDDGIAALRALGTEVVEEGAVGHLPVTVRGPADRDRGSASAPQGRPAGVDRTSVRRMVDSTADSSAGSDASAVAGWSPSRVVVAGDVSSQFLSGLLLTGPVWSGGMDIAVEGELVSRPYVEMTLAVMRAFGAKVEANLPPASAPRDASRGRPGDDEQGGGRSLDGWRVLPGGYRGVRYLVEPDASAASYFFAAAAICGGRVTVEGLGRRSLQGDLGFVDVLARMGCQVEQTDTATTVERRGELSGIDVDMGELSDTAQTLAAVAVFAQTPTRVTGIGFIRAKETDRVGNVVRELRRCGIEADEEPDGFVIRPGEPKPTVVQTYDDHRMAMSFALLGLRSPGIEVADPECVAKTFPDFWDALDSLRSSKDHDR